MNIIERLEELREALKEAREAIATANVLIGAKNNSLSEAQRQGNVNQAWHELKRAGENIDAALKR